jgi:hypothetical protein
LLLQALCAWYDDVELSGFPSSAEAFEACVKATASLATDRDNLAAKLDAFLRRTREEIPAAHGGRHTLGAAWPPRAHAEDSQARRWAGAT